MQRRSFLRNATLGGAFLGIGCGSEQVHRRAGLGHVAGRGLDEMAAAILAAGHFKPTLQRVKRFLFRNFVFFPPK